MLFGAAVAADLPNRAALIIGIGHYAGPAADLLGVPADVEMAKEISKAMDIPDKNITVLRDKDATKKNILEALQVFGKKAANGGRVLIYFSGHGTRYYNPFINNCVEGLLSYDYQTISNTEVAQAIQYLNDTVDKSIVIVDACHSAGVMNKVRTRSSLSKSDLVAKFASKDKSGEEVCAPVNYRTRSLFDETQALGAIQENIVYVSSAKPEEVSWDQAGKGGVATQALKQCLLGRAQDINNSGAVSLDEVRQCAQKLMYAMVPGPDQVASHITIKGNRNLIPVINDSGKKPNIQISSLSNSDNQPNKPGENLNTTPVGVPPTKPVVTTTTVVEMQKQKEDPVAASLASLKDIEAQRNPNRVVDVKVSKRILKIDKDYLDLEVKSSSNGYMYLVLLGSDKQSFYVLYPNKLDSNNFIKANTPMKISSKDWQIKAAGPAGVDHMLLIVSDSPKDLSTLGSFGDDSNSPFVYTLNNLSGRKSLIDHMVGKDKNGVSEKFGAKLFSVTEVK